MVKKLNSDSLFSIKQFVVTSFFTLFIVVPFQSKGADSASKIADDTSAGQKMISGVTGIAAGAAGMKAVAACSGKPNPSCKYYVALTAGLTGATYLLMSESTANKDLAAQYQGNCIIKGPAYQWRGSESYGICVSLSEECTQLGGTWAPIRNRCLLPEEACTNIGRTWNPQTQECNLIDPDSSDPNSDSNKYTNKDNCPAGKIRIAGLCKTPTPAECLQHGREMLNGKCVEGHGGGGGSVKKLEDFFKKKGIKWNPKKTTDHFAKWYDWLCKRHGQSIKAFISSGASTF